MNGSQVKEIAYALGKFAVTRETAKAPESVIGVQASGSQMKFISGNSKAGVVVSGVPYDGDREYRVTVSARPFLQAAKVLPTKTEVALKISDEGLSIVAEAGGSLDCPVVGTIRDAGFPKKPKEGSFKAVGRVQSADWKRMANLFKKVSQKVEVPSIRLVKDKAYATAVAPGNRPMYVTASFPGEGEHNYNMSAYRDFWQALSTLKEDGEIRWGRLGVTARTGDVELFSAPYLVSRYDAKTGRAGLPEEAPPWPLLQTGNDFPTSFTCNRRDLITIIKGQAPYDEHNRVTLEVDTGFVKVVPFGVEAGQRFEAETTGSGIRSVNADYLNGLLSNMDSKEVTLRWGGGSRAVSLTAQGYEDWTILIAPVAL